MNRSGECITAWDNCSSGGQEGHLRRRYFSRDLAGEKELAFSHWRESASGRGKSKCKGLHED
jgi:hypothetical protein